jgi:hypothetical protein
VPSDFPTISAFFVSMAAFLSAAAVWYTDLPKIVKAANCSTRFAAGILYFIFNYWTIDMANRSNESRVLFIVLFVIEIICIFYVRNSGHEKRLIDERLMDLLHDNDVDKTLKEILTRLQADEDKPV